MPVDHAICIVAYNSVSKQLLASNVDVSIGYFILPLQMLTSEV